MASEHKILVMGQGALGTLFASVMAKAGHDVHVVSARAHGPAQHELAVQGRRRVKGRVTISDELPDDAVYMAFLTGRSDQALDQAMAARWHLVDNPRDHGVLVPVQNGLVQLDILREMGDDVVVPTVVGFNAQMAEDGNTVKLTSPGGIVTGSVHSSTGQAVERLARWTLGPIPARKTDNPVGAVWSKWCVSCAINGLAVVGGDGVGTLTRSTEGREALIGVVTECVAITQAEGVRLERVAGPLTPDRLAGPVRGGLGGVLRHGLVRLIGRRYRGVVPSSLDAARSDRDPELDALNGRAVALGDEHATETPWNRAVLDVAREVAAGKREPGREALLDAHERARTKR